MATLKTQPTDRSVDLFLDGVADEERRKDCRTVLAMMKRATKAAPKLWGTSIVGFGSYHYRSESGREGDWFEVGFSPRKNNLTVYIMGGLLRHAELLKALGKYKAAKSCLYIKRLTDVNRDVLQKLIAAGVVHLRSRSGH